MLNLTLPLRGIKYGRSWVLTLINFTETFTVDFRHGIDHEHGNCEDRVQNETYT